MIGSKHIFIIGSCKASGAALTTINGVEAVSIFPEAAEALYEAGGGEAASLFALPERVVRPDAGIDTITWYTDVSGTPAPLASLPAAEQLTATARLEVILRRLAETRSPAVQGFLRAALNVLTPESLHVVSGQPVIINWGMVPEAAAADSDSHAAHVAATVGPYLPPSIRPELAVDEPAFATPQDGAGAAGVATAAVAGAAVLTGAATAAAAEGSAEGSDETSGDAQDADALPSDSYGTADADAVEPAGPGGETHRETTVVDGAPAHVAVERPSVWRDSAFATLIGLVVLLLLFVVYALWPGNLIYPQPARSARITDDDALAARRQINRSLREQITELQDLSDEDVCRLAPGVLETGLRVPPVGPTAPIQPTPGTGMPPRLRRRPRQTGPRCPMPRSPLRALRRPLGTAATTWTIPSCWNGSNKPPCLSSARRRTAYRPAAASSSRPVT
ncbi:hypothetical protein [Breoghania sp. L-A4]|uniref:hypothetical protein n=1 Tax=Breoghania sp. L-A4 TaxID=2304600 RepID=UPI0013C2A89B|nr:hypothetical protein [Breoghania sp. L-A4]